MALLRQSEAISDNRWQNLENNSDLINLKHIVFVINVFLFPPRRKVGAKVLCDETKESFAAPWLSFLLMRESWPLCHKAHRHHHVKIIIIVNATLFMWTMFECYNGKILPWHCRNISFCHCHKQQRVLKNQKTKKDIFTFSVAPSQLPSIDRGLLECIRRSSVVVAGCYWKQKEKLV